MTMKTHGLFDAHFHIVDPRFPLVANAGYLPDIFTVVDYLTEVAPLGVTGGAVVSGSFHAYDQTYLEHALSELGPGFVGVTQLASTAHATEIARLDGLGVRALRFNLKRGIHPSLGDMAGLARLAYDTRGWHTELYVDSRDLPDLRAVTDAVPVLCIDHLGLSRTGFPHLLRLVERGAYVKATGFGRVDLPVEDALRAVARVNPNALLFGTDLPGTRAPKRFAPGDVERLCDALDDDALVRNALFENAARLYKKKPRSPGGRTAG